MKATLTLAEACEMAGMQRRQLLRWLKARLHIEPEVLHRAEGERVWYIRREPLKRLLGVGDSDVADLVARHGKEISQHAKQIERLEAIVATCIATCQCHRMAPEGHPKAI